MIAIIQYSLVVLFTLTTLVIVVLMSVVSVMRRLYKVKDVTEESFKNELTFDGVPEQLKYFMFRGVSSEE